MQILDRKLRLGAGLATWLEPCTKIISPLSTSPLATPTNPPRAQAPFRRAIPLSSPRRQGRAHPPEYACNRTTQCHMLIDPRTSFLRRSRLQAIEAAQFSELVAAAEMPNTARSLRKALVVWRTQGK